ncbi:MAG: hypothetical protein P1R58_02415 [bacterium]|nr:hypothetical protein [bacterium]
MVSEGRLAEVMSIPLMIYCLVVAGVYLLLTSAILQWIEKKLKLAEPLPPELREETGFGWFMTNYIMEFLFYVTIPTMAYGFLYVVLPLEGIRAGIAATLVAFTLGAVPFTMGITLRVKLPVPLVMFSLLSLLIKLGGALALIGYLYAL